MLGGTMGARDGGSGGTIPVGDVQIGWWLQLP
jgi:hypothetical protein